MDGREKDMVFKRRGDLFIVVHNEKTPHHDEWSAYAEATRAAVKERNRDFSKMRHLVITDGGGPNLMQRKIAYEALEGHNVRVAVVSRSPLVRGIVTAFTWYNRMIKVFNPEEIEQALRHVGVEPGTEYARSILSDIRSMRREVSRIKPSSLDR